MTAMYASGSFAESRLSLLVTPTAAYETVPRTAAQLKANARAHHERSQMALAYPVRTWGWRRHTLGEFMTAEVGYNPDNATRVTVCKLKAVPVPLPTGRVHRLLCRLTRPNMEQLYGQFQQALVQVNTPSSARAAACPA